jgi:signal transduction histidine kinase
VETRPETLDPFARWLLEALGSGLIAVDAHANVVSLNGEAMRILASQHPDIETPPGGALLGRPCREVLATQPRLCACLVEALDGAESPGRLELTLESSEPEAATIGYSLATIRDPAGAIRGAAIQFRDLTPIERRAARERLRERLVALGEMAAGLAHEIRNPLAAMEISAGLLKRRIGDDPGALALVEDLRGEVGRVAATVHQSLEFVRPVSLEPEAVDAVALLEQSLRVARARSGYRGRIERAFPAQLLSPLLVDIDGVRAVLTNLLLNAFEALEGRAAAEQCVVLAACEASERAEIAIRICDNGPGIPAEHRERVFYPFFTTKQNGSGVGLAMAQKLVAEHGGRLELENGPGAGAAFRIHLPCIREQAP